MADRYGGINFAIWQGDGIAELVTGHGGIVEIG